MAYNYALGSWARAFYPSDRLPYSLISRYPRQTPGSDRLKSIHFDVQFYY